MAPSDDDDQRVPDEADAGAESSELPAGTSRPELGRGDDRGEQRSPGRVVFDVEVDDPSLVMPRPSRRARAKATSEVAEEAEIEDGETIGDTDDTRDTGDTADTPRPLVHGDPLLTGPTPVVKARRSRARAHDTGNDSENGRDDAAATASPALGPARHDAASGQAVVGSGDDEPASPAEGRDTGSDLGAGADADASNGADDGPAVAAVPPSIDERASDDPRSAGGTSTPGEEPPTDGAATSEDVPATDGASTEPDATDASEPAPATSPTDDGTVRRDERSGTPPLSPKDLFEPVTGEQPAVPDPPRTDVPPPPPSGGDRSDRPADAPPPPPAPALAGTPAPGITRPVPPVTGPTAPTARRAARGAQVTGQTPAVASGDPSGPVPTTRPTAVAPAPRFAGRRPRVRRVTRVVRHVDPWSVFKVAAVFSFVAYGIALVAGVLLWNVAYATGTIDNIERGLESTGWETFELNGGEIFHNAWIGGLFAAVGLTGLAVLVATLFNLITDLVGGLRMTVLEEEVVEKSPSPMRRYAGKTAPDPVPPARPTQPRRSSRRR